MSRRSRLYGQGHAEITLPTSFYKVFRPLNAGVVTEKPSHELNGSQSPRSLNAGYARGITFKRFGHDLFGLSDLASNKILLIDQFETLAGGTYLLAHTKAGLWKYDSNYNAFFKVGGSYDTTSDDTDYPVSVTFTDKYIFTEGLSTLKSYDGTSNNWSEIICPTHSIVEAPIAKYLASFADRVYSAHTIEGGNPYPHRIRWCDSADYRMWDESTHTGAGLLDLFETVDFIKGLSVLEGSLVAYKEKSIWPGRRTGNPYLPVAWEAPSVVGIGVAAARSLTSIGIGDIFLGWDNVYIHNLEGLTEAAVSVRKDLVDNIDPLHYTQAQGVWVEGLDEYWLTYTPTGGTTNSKTWAYNINEKSWAPTEDLASAFGFYTLSSSRTIDSLTGTIDALPGTIDGRASLSGFPITLSGRYDGLIYAHNETGYKARTANHVVHEMDSMVGNRWLQHCLDATEWTGGGDAADIADNTSLHHHNAGCVLFDKSATTVTWGRIHTTDVQLAVSTDVTNYHFWVYIPDLTDVASVDCYVGTDATDHDYWTTADTALLAGWNHLSLSAGAPTGTGGTGLGTAIGYLAVTVTLDASGDTLAGICVGPFYAEMSDNSIFSSNAAGTLAVTDDYLSFNKVGSGSAHASIWIEDLEFTADPYTSFSLDFYIAAADLSKVASVTLFLWSGAYNGTSLVNHIYQAADISALVGDSWNTLTFTKSTMTEVGSVDQTYIDGAVVNVITDNVTDTLTGARLRDIRGINPGTDIKYSWETKDEDFDLPDIDKWLHATRVGYHTSGVARTIIVSVSNDGGNTWLPQTLALPASAGTKELKFIRPTWNMYGRIFRARVENSDDADLEIIEIVFEATPGGKSFA